MAVFGLPGGAEWIFILVILVLLFVPGVLVFWFGYLTGRNAGVRDATRPPSDELVAPTEETHD